MKKTKKLFSYLRIPVYALIIFLATVTLSKEQGILRTLPFVFVLPALATVFYNKKTLTVILCAAVSFILGLIEAPDMKSEAVTALFAAVFSAAGILVKRLIVTSKVAPSKKILCYILSAVIAVSATAGYFAVFGNPISHLAAHRANSAYIDSTYPEENIETEHTSYDFFDRKYYTTVIFKDVSRIRADISYSDSMIFDGYRNYYEYQLLNERRAELSSALLDGFPSQSSAVRINAIETESTIDSKSTADEFRSDMIFDIAFYAQITDAEGFREKCQEYISYLSETGFEFGKINFYGGFADEFEFEMCYPYDFGGNISELITDFSEETFDRYYDEEDYIEGWSYTS